MNKITTEWINSNIATIQKMLNVDITGIWDNTTSAALKNIQLRLQLPGTGLPDVDTIEALHQRLGNTMNIEETHDDALDIDASTDRSEVITNNIQIEDFLLPSSEYSKDNLNYDYIFLHHTAGSYNPKNVISDWATDTRGKIGTQYVIGGMDLTGKDRSQDGKIVRCIPDGSWASHLGSYKMHKIDFGMHKNSIGIELCNYGWLTNKNGVFYTYTNKIVPKEQVVDLGYSFRGYRFWHAYTDAQLSSLKVLLLILATKYNIDLNAGLKSWMKSIQHSSKAFEFIPEALTGNIRGLLSHTNVRKDKFDVSPQPKLIDMIINL